MSWFVFFPLLNYLCPDTPNSHIANQYTVYHYVNMMVDQNPVILCFENATNLPKSQVVEATEDVERFGFATERLGSLMISSSPTLWESQNMVVFNR